MADAYVARNPFGIYSLEEKTSRDIERVLNHLFTRREPDDNSSKVSLGK